MDWDKLRVFYAVANAGGFTHAEEVLHIGHSSISRHIKQLEDDLQTPLFHRHPRGLNLTGAGEILYETVHDIFDKLDHTKGRILDAGSDPRGPIKVSMAIGFGAVWVTNRIRGFIETYPQMEVRLLFQDRLADLSMGEADVAIRMIRQDQGDLISAPFVAFRYHLYASADYLERHGMPKSPQDLAEHNLIALDRTSNLPKNYFNWFLSYSGMHTTPILSVDNPFGIYLAVRNGLGIGVIPDLMITDNLSDNDKLKIVLPEHSSFDLQTYFVYPIELRNTKRIRVFKEYMMAEAAKTQALRVAEESKSA